MAPRDLFPEIVQEGSEQGNPKVEPETSVGGAPEQAAEVVVRRASREGKGRDKAVRDGQEGLGGERTSVEAR